VIDKLSGIYDTIFPRAMILAYVLPGVALIAQAAHGLSTASGGRTLASVLWGLSLIACPIIMLIFGAVYEVPASPESFSRPFPWQTYVVQDLFLAHLGVSLAAAVAVNWLAPSWGPRLNA
jgi:hypothetical protein